MKVAVANLKAKMSAAKTRADLKRILTTDPDVVGLCEIGGMARAVMLKVGFARAGMTMWAAIPTPIAWRKTWTLIAKGKTHLSDKTNVGASGAGPTWLRAKDAPWVLLHEPMGDLHFVILAHLAPQPGLNDKRGRLHAQQVDALAAKIAAVKAENPGVICHVLGDLNTPDRDRLLPITEQGIDFGAVTPDLHGHQLTYIGSFLKGSRDMIRRLNTDHNAVTANLKHKGAPVPTPNPIPDRLERVTFRGKPMDQGTKYALMSVEAILGYELTVTQGCYSNSAVSASATTHNGGGVVDLAPWDQANKVKVWRDNIGPAWFRPAIPGLWPDHIHAIVAGHPNLDPQAVEQVVDYNAGKDGLKGDRPDPNPYRPNPLPAFDYRAAVRDERLRENITGLKARIATLRDRISANRNRITYK